MFVFVVELSASYMDPYLKSGAWHNLLSMDSFFLLYGFAEILF